MAQDICTHGRGWAGPSHRKSLHLTLQDSFTRKNKTGPLCRSLPLDFKFLQGRDQFLFPLSSFFCIPSS